MKSRFAVTVLTLSSESMPQSLERIVERRAGQRIRRARPLDGRVLLVHVLHVEVDRLVRHQVEPERVAVVLVVAKAEVRLAVIVVPGRNGRIDAKRRNRRHLQDQAGTRPIPIRDVEVPHLGLLADLGEHVEVISRARARRLLDHRANREVLVAGAVDRGADDVLRGLRVDAERPIVVFSGVAQVQRRELPGRVPAHPDPPSAA